MDYRYVEKLFDMLVEYFHNKPPPEEHDGRGEWIRVRDGLQGAEHCIRVLTPEEFEDWHRAIETPIQVEFGRRPVAFCSHEGQWWVIYDDTEESEVIRRFEKCFEGPEDEAASAGQVQDDFDVEQAVEISGFFGMRVMLDRRVSPPPRFHVAYDSARAEFSITPVGIRRRLSPAACEDAGAGMGVATRKGTAGGVARPGSRPRAGENCAVGVRAIRRIVAISSRRSNGILPRFLSAWYAMAESTVMSESLMVSMKDIRAVGRTIAREFRPQQVILFGSHTRGSARGFRR